MQRRHLFGDDLNGRKMVRCWSDLPSLYVGSTLRLQHMSESPGRNSKMRQSRNLASRTRSSTTSGNLRQRNGNYPDARVAPGTATDISSGEFIELKIPPF